jgi:hypothetical protein
VPPALSLAQVDLPFHVRPAEDFFGMKLVVLSALCRVPDYAA